MGESINAVIFDLDGTLLYTLDDIRNALNHSLELHGYPPLDLQKVRSLVGHGLVQLARDALPQGTGEETADAIYRELAEHYAADPVGVSRPYRGIIPMLDTLKDRGLPMAVWSNKDENLVKTICGKLFPGYFTVCAGRRPGLPAKPAPEAGAQILSLMGQERESVLYVGDSEVDAMTAANSGMPFMAVGWGYRDREFLEQSGARWIIDEPAELPILI